MYHGFKQNQFVWLAIGLFVGLVVGSFFPHAPLHATATDRFENFAIATGAVDDGVEAIYFLDFLTGELRAAVLSKQHPVRFNSFYQRNIAADMGVDPSKNPRYLMVTGLVNIRRGASRLSPSSAVVYVAEITSGQVAAYAIPWNADRHASGQLFKGEILPLDKTKFRTAVVRDQ
ncbi:MAG: hypothetical protein U9N87_14305 [Planctomycetota bacterium]|nr:hypothetical protein [Planctomycetota bacterium]